MQQARHSAGQALHQPLVGPEEGETLRWVLSTANLENSADSRRIRLENCSRYRLLGQIVAATGRAFHLALVAGWIDVLGAVPC